MSLQPTLSTPICPANRHADWESAAMGVEFIFKGGYGLSERAGEIGDYQDCSENLQVAGSKLNTRQTKREVQE